METKKKQYCLNDVLHFGKHRNHTLKYVLDSDNQYIFWCLSNLPTFEMSCDAWTYASTLNPSFFAIKPTTSYEAVPYSEGVELLLCNPWYEKQMANLKKIAEDVQVVSSIPKHHRVPPVQLSLW